MCRSPFPLAVVTLLAAYLFSAAAMPAAQTSSKAPTAAPKAAAPSKAPAAKPKPTARKSTRRSSSRNWRVAQTKPTPARYREIQKALAERGYVTPVDGLWGSQSIEALRKFQADQHLAGDGKLTSLTLIGLGLGPERVGAASIVQPRK